jgi:hypothetical protein
MIFRTPSGNALVLGAIICLIIISGISGAIPDLGNLVLAQKSNVSVIFESSNCGYTNPFGLVSPEPVITLGDKSTPPGTTFTLGTFPEGTQLVFAIKSDDGTFYTGPGTINPDKVVHAKVTKISGGWLIEWEDLYGGGDNDFNDIVFRVIATPFGTPVPEFPSPGIPLILAAAIGGCALFARRKIKR